MKIIMHWLLSALAVVVVSYVLPGVFVETLLAAFVAAIIIGILNAFIRPILLILTLPITVLTFGIFAFVINAFLVMLTAKIVDGFYVENFLWALGFSLLLSLVSSFLYRLEGSKR